MSQNYPEALRWYERTAEHGNTNAKFSLAGMYFGGLGVAKNFAEAARWYGCKQPCARPHCPVARTLGMPIFCPALKLCLKIHCH